MQIAFDSFERIQNAVHVAALVAVAGVDAGADEAVADVIARAERRFHVGAVVRIDIDGIVRALALGRVDEPPESLAQMDTCRSVQARPSPTQPMSTLMDSVTPSGTEAEPPKPTSS